MTNEEILKELTFLKRSRCFGCMHPQEVGYCKNNCRSNNAIDVAIEAIEKQMPKKPKITKFFEEECYNRVVCPECEYTFLFNEFNIRGSSQLRMFAYCPDCGQAIDWSIEDNETD